MKQLSEAEFEYQQEKYVERAKVPNSDTNTSRYWYALGWADALDKPDETLDNRAKNNFAKNLYILRTSQGMTLEELGEKVGVTSKSIGKYERGNSTPTLEHLVKLADVLNVNLYTLINADLKLTIRFIS